MFEIDNDDMAVRDYAHLFAMLTSHPDSGADMDGMNRLSWVIHEHAKTIHLAHERMGEIVKELKAATEVRGASCG